MNGIPVGRDVPVAPNGGRNAGEIAVNGEAVGRDVPVAPKIDARMVDTKFFGESFRQRLLASIDDFDAQCDGVLVHGENFQALNLLQERYREQVKCIYIDPPYNTGSDGFPYRDGYSHSSWIALLQDRLEKAREEMPSDGIIFISINDNEQGNLKLLCQQVFGERNFITTLPRKGVGGRQDSKHFAIVHEYVLAYAKDIDRLRVGRMEHESPYPLFDEKKNLHYNTMLLRKWGDNCRREDRPNLYYPIYCDVKTGAFSISRKSADDLEIYPMLDIVFAERVKRIEARLGDPDVVLNSFILSPTPYQDLIWSPKPMAELLERRHVLFMEDGGDTYLSRLFRAIVG